MVEATNIEPQRRFGPRLVAAGEQRGRLCVGIDPHPHLMAQWGLDDDIAGLRSFALRCVEAFGSTVAVVKPQVAFFERFGSQGFAVLEETLAGLRELGCLTIADAKRGDIGSTMAGYAQAWLGESSPLRSDAVTVSPYLGTGALTEVFDLARDHGAGVFVLAATSNPEARQLQSAQLMTPGSEALTVAQSVVDDCAELNKAADAAGQPGDIGVVIGATVSQPPQLSHLNGPVLLPGVGAQGAGAEQVASIMSHRPELGFANVSRSVLAAGPSPSQLRAAAAAQAAEFMEIPR